MLTDIIERDLGNFLNALNSNDNHKARDYLEHYLERFTYTTEAEQINIIPYFFDIIRQKPWNVQEKLFDKPLQPTNFFLHEDSKNESVLHYLAEDQQSTKFLKSLINRPFSDENEENQNKSKIRNTVFHRNSGVGRGTPLNIAILGESNQKILKIFDRQI